MQAISHTIQFYNNTTDVLHKVVYNSGMSEIYLVVHHEEEELDGVYITDFYV